MQDVHDDGVKEGGEGDKDKNASACWIKRAKAPDWEI